MPQQTASSQDSQKQAGPKRLETLFHPGKTLKLISVLLRDPRIPFIRKVAFFAAILFVLALLLFPDLFAEAVLSVILPFVGTILGIPLDAGFDWFVLALAVVSLLKVFPQDLVAEHYAMIFKQKAMPK